MRGTAPRVPLAHVVVSVLISLLLSLAPRMAAAVDMARCLGLPFMGTAGASESIVSIFRGIVRCGRSPDRATVGKLSCGWRRGSRWTRTWMVCSGFRINWTAAAAWSLRLENT